MDIMFSFFPEERIVSTQSFTRYVCAVVKY